MRHTYVRCHECDERFESDAVKFLNIESDIMERDLMTFECPECHTEQQSLVTT